MQGIVKGSLYKTLSMLAKIRSRVVSFRVGTLTTCFKEQVSDISSTGRSLKSPSKIIKGLAYLSKKHCIESCICKIRSSCGGA